jgi:hypothetical protein
VKLTYQQIEAKVDVVEDIRKRGVDQPGEALRTLREMGRGNRETLAKLARGLGADYVECAW